MPLRHLPTDETRQANRKVGRPFNERQRQGLAGRDAEQRTYQDEACLLSPQRARNCEGRTAHGVEEALYHNRLRHTDRAAQKCKGYISFRRTDQPACKMNKAAHQRRSARMDRRQPLVDLVDSAA